MVLEKMLFANDLSLAMTSTVKQVQNSLVVIQNGHLGTGAGIIWQRDGWILTNRHVVGGKKVSTRLKVIFANGAECDAEMVFEDTQVDLCLLRTCADGFLPARIGDSRKLRVGQIVLAIGHPWGQRGFVTAGLVSGLDVLQPTEGQGRVDRTTDLIRTDVRLAPGNSGGPLVNPSGEVVGINTMVVGGDLGVAIPSHVASSFFENALNQKRLKLAHSRDGGWLA